MSSAKHPLQRPWTYWELRQPWVKPKQDWNALPTPLFTVATAEDFFACYNRSPKIIEVFDDGRSGPNNVVEREEKGEPGGKVKTGVQGYMLFRKDFVPETSFEVDGERKHLNGYRTEVSCSGKDFENFQKAWETVVLAVIGEVVDPGEYINGVYLTDKHRGKSAALRLEIWFGEKDNAICEAICGEIRALLAEESSLPFRFQQMPYYEGKTGGGGGGGGYARRPNADRDDGGGGGYGGGGYGGGDRDRGDRGDRGDRRDDRGGGGGRRDDRDGGGRRDGGFGGGGGGYGGGGGRSGYGATDPRDRRAGPGGFGR